MTDLMILGKQWKDDGSKQATRKKYFNFVGVPIVGPTSLETETYVIDVFGIQTLHCILGGTRALIFVVFCPPKKVVCRLQPL